ncbi:MAG TPA: outer membrane protein assembly factor BamA, partial [Thermodesulfobacteriota bacterium]|nr:outer membrane protein assembly factor BamA [Thermodesulfobacteriota bacterium]
EPRVAEVVIRGNRRIEEAVIRARVKTRAGEPLSRAQVREDVKAIYQLGYFDDVRVEVAPGPTGQVVTFVVVERPQIGQIVFEGRSKLSEEELREALTIKPNTLADPAAIRASEQKLKALYAERGYLDATVTSRLDPQPDQRVTLVFVIREGEKVPVRRVEFEGNQAFTDGRLARVVSTKRRTFWSWLTGSDVLKPDALERDQALLTQFYLDRGYANVRVGRPRVERRPEGLVITYPIQEGPRFTIGAVGFSGELLKPEAELRGRLRTRPGRPFSASDVRRDIDTLQTIYADEGYAFAAVTPQTRVNEARRTIDLTFELAKNQRVRFGEIEITGNVSTRDKVIRRELKIAEGELYSATGLARSRQRLRQLGFFKDVRISTTPVEGTGQEVVDVAVAVEEQPTGQFTFGAGFSSEEAFSFVTQLSQLNLFGLGHRVALSGRFGTRVVFFDLSYTDPYFLDTRLSAGIDLFRVEREFTDFDRKNAGGVLRFGYPLSDTWRVNLAYKLEEIRITNVEPTVTSPFILSQAALGTVLSSGVTLSLRHDGRDYFLDPTRGDLTSFTLEVAGGPFGGNIDIYRLEASTRWYRPLFWRLIGSAALTVGHVDTLEGGPVPVFERYFLGGINSLRGYQARSVGPQDPPGSGVVVGGETALFGSVELLIPLFPESGAGLKWLFFFDIGNAFGRGEAIDLSRLKRSWGYGIRWLSPLGPIRLEFGRPLDLGPGDRKESVQFTIGTVF